MVYDLKKTGIVVWEKRKEDKGALGHWRRNRRKGVTTHSYITLGEPREAT